jgi:hypothetical protein
MAAAGVKDMTPIDVLVLHHVAHRDTEKRLADICFVLNVEDTHVVSYSLRKLAGLGLVQSAKRGKEAFFSVTAAGPRDLPGLPRRARGLPDARLHRQRRGERPHRRARPTAAHALRALRPGGARNPHNREVSISALMWNST